MLSSTIGPDSSPLHHFSPLRLQGSSLSAHGYLSQECQCGPVVSPAQLAPSWQRRGQFPFFGGLPSPSMRFSQNLPLFRMWGTRQIWTFAAKQGQNRKTTLLGGLLPEYYLNLLCKSEMPTGGARFTDETEGQQC